MVNKDITSAKNKGYGISVRTADPTKLSTWKEKFLKGTAACFKNLKGVYD